jgi:dienelactone hydrolase
LATLAGLLVWSSGALGQGETFGLDAGKYSVGFRLLEEQDRSRAVSGGVRGATHPRPVRAYVWYPARSRRSAAPLTFGRYAAFADEDVWPAEIAGELRERLRYSNGPLARSLSSEDFVALLERPMRAVEDAAPIDGPFPLVIIALGLYYEAPITFAAFAEYLAGSGFVVATAPLVGTHTAIVRLDVPDLETQMRDLEVVIARARQFPFVDRERLGVLGFDQGGMAGVVLTMRNRDVDAFVSLDSGIQYPHESGLPRTSPHYDALALRVPWLHAANQADQPPSPDAPSLFDEAVHADRYWLRIAALGHVDFTSYALVEGRGAAAGYWGPATPQRAAAHLTMADYVRRFFAAHLTGEDAGAGLFDEAMRQLPAESGMTVQHRAGVPAAITYDELVRALVAGRGEEAVAALRSLAASAPEHELLTEFALGRLCVSLLYSWHLPRQALPLAEFARELYPESPGGKSLLAETHAALENYPAAIALYEQLVAQFPDAAQLAARLAELHNRR